MSLPRSVRRPADHREWAPRQDFLAPQPDARRAASMTSSYRTALSPSDHRRAASVGQPKSKWPPAPSVEDEVISLSREMSPPPAQHPADEVHSRGLVDQVPIMEETEGTSHPAKKRSGTHGSAPASGSTTPASANSNEERRFVVVSKTGAVDDGEKRTNKLPVKHDEGKVQGKRSKSSLRIDPNAARHGSARAVSSGPAPSSAKAKGNVANYVTSPAPISSSQVNFNSPNALLSDRYGPRPPLPDRLGTQSSSTSDPTRSSSFPRQFSSTSGIDHLVASVHSMQQSIRKDVETYSDTSSRSGRRGRDRKPRSRANSSSSGSSSDDGPEYREAPAKRSSPYSYSGSKLPKDSRTSSGRTSTKQPDSGVPHRSSTHGSGPTLTPTDPTSATWNHHRQLLPHGRSPGVSLRGSPIHSPVNTPPPSPGYNRNSLPAAASPAAHSRQGSRPVTPTWLSPPHNAGFEAHDSSHLYTSYESTHHPTSQPTTPTREQSQPQMAELNRGTSPFTSRSRPTSPLPPHNPGVASQSGPKCSTQPPDQGPTGFNQGAAPSATGKINGGQNGAPPPLPERPGTMTLDPNAPSGQARPRRSFEQPTHPADPSQAVIRSRSAAPHELPKLPPCPRPSYVKGYNDWSTLPGHPEFDICPTCRKGLEDAGIDTHFIPTEQQVPEVAIRCDMSVPWVRMAWLLLLQRRSTHPTVIHEVTSVLSDREPCPGRELASRKWHRLYDWEHERYLSNFDVCPRCVRLVEALFPNLRGIFEPPAKHHDSVRNCDLRVDSRRFVRYLDLLDNISHQAHEYRHEPKSSKFVSLAKKLSSVRECRQDDQLREQPWHFIPHLPDFTVCEECYKDEVLPQAKAGSDLAAQFNRSSRLPPQTPMPLSCQLYSPRMREVWVKACDREDFELIRNAVRQRVAKERELQIRHARIQHLPEERRLSEGAALVSEWRRWA